MVPVIVIAALITSVALQFRTPALAVPNRPIAGPASEPRAQPAPTLPPLPISMPSGAPAMRSTMPYARSTGRLRWERVARRADVHVPALSEAIKLAAGVRRPMNAAGATIILTGDQFNFLAQDLTLAYGADIFAYCENMTPGDTYKYYIVDPRGNAFQSGATTTGGSGQCGADVHFNLSTPFTAIQADATVTTVGTDPAYSGVWALGMIDTSNGPYKNQFQAMSYLVQISAFNFNTFSDAAGLNAATDFAPAGIVYVRASGLNPSHNYQMGFVYTAGLDPNTNTGLPCEFSIPAVPARNLACYGPGVTVGVPVASGNFNASWATSATSPTGTYSIQLFDVTAADHVGQTQFSLNPSTTVWALTPYNSTLGNGTNLQNTFATDGLLDQSVTGLTYSISGLPAAENGKTVRLVFSDPNNMALGPATGQVLNPPPTAVVAGGSVTFTQQPFPFSSALQTAIGPTVTSFAPNISTAQLSDTTTNTVLGSKSFVVKAYQGQLAWTNPNVSILNAAVAGTTAQVTITNTAGTSFAAWNGDGISGITLAPKAGDPETLSLPSPGPFIDSAGNSWTATLTGGTIKLTPSSPSAALPANGTLSFNISVAVPSGCATTACYLQTAILPQHGIAYSAVNSATNSLGVLATGIPPNTVVPTFGYAVTGETPTAGVAPRLSIFNQAMYVQGTMGSTGADTYQITININNSGSGANRLMDFDVIFPASENFNLVSPTLNGKVNVNGANQNGWKLQVQSANPSLPGANAFSIWCGSNSNNACGVPNGQTAIVKINLPMPLTSFPLQNISGNANFDGGCQGGACTLPAYALTPNGTTTSAIAGPSNLNSSELGAYSLLAQFMQMNFAPATIPSGKATTTVLKFTNSPTSSDPNPDYVDQINLSFPASGIVPNSITVPAPWIATKTTAAGVVPAKWTIGLCASPTPATPCTTTEPNAIAPGGTLAITLNYTGGGATAGTYSIGWSVTGANGGGNTLATANTVPITASNSSATAAITNVGGYTGGPIPAPTPVPAGTEPTIGTDASATFGTSYLYTITNNGSTTITAASIKIPNQTTSFGTGTDGTTYLAFGGGSAPVVTLSGGATGTAGTCSGTLTSGFSSASGGSNGAINLAGCTIPPGGVATVYFSLRTPYLVGSEFAFTSTVTVGAAIATTPTYATAQDMQVVLDGRLTLITPPNGGVTANIIPAGLSGATPVTYPIDGSVVVNTGTSPTTINFGTIAGVLPMRDMVDASVQSNASGTNKWMLYVNADNNPTNGVSPQFSTKVDQPNSSAVAGFTVNTGVLTSVPTTVPGLLLSTYQGTPYHNPLDSVMTFQIDTGAPFAVNSGPQNVLVTYTLIAQ